MTALARLVTLLGQRRWLAAGPEPALARPAVMAGAAMISYEIKSVAVTAGVAKITFRILKDGAPVSSFNTPVPTQSSSTGVYSVPSNFEAIDGFTGGPTFYVVYAVPQDGIAAPADYNTYQSVSLTPQGGQPVHYGVVCGRHCQWLPRGDLDR